MFPYGALFRLSQPVFWGLERQQTEYVIVSTLTTPLVTETVVFPATELGRGLGNEPTEVLEGIASIKEGLKALGHYEE